MTAQGTDIELSPVLDPSLCSSHWWPHPNPSPQLSYRDVKWNQRILICHRPRLLQGWWSDFFPLTISQTSLRFRWPFLSMRSLSSSLSSASSTPPCWSLPSLSPSQLVQSPWGDGSLAGPGCFYWTASPHLSFYRAVQPSASLPASSYCTPFVFMFWAAIRC